MSSVPKRGRRDALAVATAQFYNTTGTVPSQLRLLPDISYLISSHPSCTIVVYELPVSCADYDLFNLFSQFGQVKRTKIVCNRRAALVEFCDISTPTRLVHMSKTNPFFVGSTHVRLEFSSESIGPSNTSKSGTDKPASSNEPTHILHFDIAAADYPITVDVIKTICSPHGKIQRIFIGKKNVDRSLEVLVEFQTVDEARIAKEQLDGADIYSNCCNLTVTYSKIPKVHVTKNDSESWDFTGPNAVVPGPISTSAGQRTLLSTSFAMANTSSTPLIQSAPFATHSQPSTAPSYVNSMYPPHVGYYAAPPYVSTYQSSPMYRPPLLGSYGPPVSTSSNDAARHSQRPTTTTQSQSTPPQKVVILPTPTLVHPVSETGIGLGHATSNLNTSASAALQTDVSVFESIEGVVLMACSLPEHFNCDHLFNLICLYGNIARIKFLKTRPGCAMIQVGTPEAADHIHRYYNSVNIFDRTIQFYHSKQIELTEHDNPGKLDDGSPVMKNYMNDPNNRFRNAAVASRSRILEPSRTLHFFNTPLYITPEDVSDIFTKAGAHSPPRIVIFATKPGQKTSLGLVEWDTLTEALEALVLVNHLPIHVKGASHPFHLKLAFSPKPIATESTGQTLIRHPAPPLSNAKNPPSTTPSTEGNKTSDQNGSNQESPNVNSSNETEPKALVTSENKPQPEPALNDTNGCSSVVECNNTQAPSSVQNPSVDYGLQKEHDNTRLDRG